VYTYDTEYTISNEANNRKLLGDPVIEGIVTHVVFFRGRLLMRYYDESLYSLAFLLSRDTRMNLMPSILLQLAKGLRHMHSLNYFHNDIKPTNILVTYEPDENYVEAVLGDLGSMKKAGLSSCTTFEYRAPEHDRGIFNTKKSDIYSLGLSIIEFMDRNSPHNYRSNPSSVPSDYPYRDLLVSMIAKDYRDRPYAEDIIFALRS